MSNKNKLNLSDLSLTIYKANIEKGWWDEPRTFAHCIGLMHSELSEALEAERKPTKPEPNPETMKLLLEEKDNNIFKMLFEDKAKDTKGDELADTIIRILDWCGHEKIDVHSHVLAKIRYNTMREHKHGGKKY